MTAAWDRDKALRVAERLDNLHPYVGTADAAALLRAADAEIARLRAREADAERMAEALRLHKAWSQSEDAGPSYGKGFTRDTHPNGERIWRCWWEGNLDLCDRAQKATDAALAAWDASRDGAE